MKKTLKDFIVSFKLLRTRGLSFEMEPLRDRTSDLPVRKLDDSIEVQMSLVLTPTKLRSNQGAEVVSGPSWLSTSLGFEPT